MTTTARREADRYEQEARFALREFSRERNIMIHLQLARDYSQSKRMEAIDFSAKSTFVQEALFPESASKDEMYMTLREAYMVGTILKTDVERAAEVWLSRWSNQGTGEKEEVFAAKIEAAASSFSGVTSLKALALMCGYSVEEVTSLSQEEVTEMCAFVAKFDAQLPWAVLVENIKADIDPSLFTSVLNNRDGLLAMALL
jgi:hypothetical protein